MTTELDEKTVELIAQYVDCDTYEQCKEFLQRHPELIDQKVCDSLFEKGFLVFATHPPQISLRFIRNGQIINYLLDLRRATNGQQDINLFFARYVSSFLFKLFLFMFFLVISLIFPFLLSPLLQIDFWTKTSPTKRHLKNMSIS